ncbi:hypothetical protein GOP47_0014981 [Adiantum capillus-veneris]|uniref:Uncharacterized protein n=1 Tax=Adiantum capillus-veneris TaxID=13818 RepID=A0A9D4UNR2_ADICA|nr:hypothetical protein GOP47_0014981 [Adiantum capillus-veneris]
MLLSAGWSRAARPLLSAAARIHHCDRRQSVPKLSPLLLPSRGTNDVPPSCNAASHRCGTYCNRHRRYSLQRGSSCVEARRFFQGNIEQAKFGDEFYNDRLPAWFL